MGKNPKLYPRDYYTSTYRIDFEQFYRKGYRGVLFDLDNTLVEHDAPIDERAKELMDRLLGLGYQICFISNNGEERVKKFADAVGATYVFKAGKPLAKGYLKGMELIGCNRSNTLFVGDQIFTDIWGANNAGIRSILVDPIAKHEEIQIVLKRIPERLIKWLYLRKHIKKGTDA